MGEKRKKDEEREEGMGEQEDEGVCGANNHLFVLFGLIGLLLGLLELSGLLGFLGLLGLSCCLFASSASFDV